MTPFLLREVFAIVCACLQYEEEKANAMMMAEEVDKAQHVSAQLEARLRETEANAAERAEKFARE